MPSTKLLNNYMIMLDRIRGSSWGEDMAYLPGPCIPSVHKPPPCDVPLIKVQAEMNCSNLCTSSIVPEMPSLMAFLTHTVLALQWSALLKRREWIWIINVSLSTSSRAWQRVRAHRIFTERIRMRCRDCPACGNGQQWEAGTGWIHNHHSSFPSISQTVPSSKLNQKQV